MGRAVDPGSPGADGSPAREERADAHGRERLMISRMALENFKSYAGIQNVGPFHKCFSSVVGPNGSGKSNVIDAMLFVFGKRAKQLRLNKVSELIHNSTHHRSLEFARVSVHFQKIIDLEGEEYEVIPDSEFVVTRIAYRNNSSKYFVDDAPSTFTEVTKLLKKEGIDLDNNRFLILQGEVEQIAMMKPKGQAPGDEGLLEYLEDIIGTNKYVESIQQSSARMEELNEKRGGLVQRVKMAEKDRDSLEDEKREAEKFMLKEAEVAKWSRAVCAISLRDAGARREQLEQKVEKLEQELQAEIEKSKSAVEELDTLRESAEELEKKYEEAKAEADKVTEEFNEFERKDVKLKTELKNAKERLKKLEEKIAKETAKLEETKAAAEDAERNLPGLEESLPGLEQQLSDEEAALDVLRGSIEEEVSKLQQQYNAAMKELEPFQEQLRVLNDKAEVTKTEHSLLAEKHKSARAQYEFAEAGIKDKGAAAEEKREALERMKQEEGQLRLEVDAAKGQEQAATARVAQGSSDLEQMRGRLTEMRSALNSERSQGAVMRAIQQQINSGALRGVYGRLGDLGGIDSKYDVAITMGCGSLDQIVVDTTETAQQCIEIIRRAEAGVASFLILEKQQHLVREMNAAIDTPEGVPRLFDLVRVGDERMRPAFYFALRNTVVAKDVEQGSRIAYGQDRRFRKVVTLNGELFEASGTMAGGGGKARGGKMGTAPKPMAAGPASAGGASSVHDAIQRLEGEVAQLEADVQSAYREQQAARARGVEAMKRLEKLQADIPKTEAELEGLGEQVADLQRRLGQLRKDAQPSRAELQQLEQLAKQVEEEEGEIEACRQSFAPLKEKADALAKSIEEAGKAKLDAQRKKITAAEKALKDCKAAIQKCKVNLGSVEKVVARLQNSIKESQEQRDGEKAAVGQKREELKSLEVEAFAVNEVFHKVKQDLMAKKEQHAAARKELAKLKQKVDKMRTGEVDAQLKLGDVKKQAKAHIEVEKALAAKLENLESHVQQLLAQLERDGLDEAQQRESMGEDPNEEELTREEAQQREAELLTQLKALKPNLAALEEYRQKQAQYEERVGELEAMTGEREEARRAHEELRKRRLDEFMAGFGIISTRLKEMYQMITLGGDAELELVDSLDPFSEGIVFSVRPPKKSWKNICNLSGGEKTLSSLALVFALHHYKPTPLYVMDEIDAALDFKNVSIVAHYIKDRTKNAQFVIISLRNNMFELADHLVGIYKTENCTKSITIDPNAFTVGAKPAPTSMPESVPMDSSAEEGIPVQSEVI